MKNPPTAEDEVVQMTMLREIGEALLIAELERRGWERGRTNIGAEAFDTLSIAVEPLPFEIVFEADCGNEALSA